MAFSVTQLPVLRFRSLLILPSFNTLLWPECSLGQSLNSSWWPTRFSLFLINVSNIISSVLLYLHPHWMSCRFSSAPDSFFFFCLQHFAHPLFSVWHASIFFLWLTPLPPGTSQTQWVLYDAVCPWIPEAVEAGALLRMLCWSESPKCIIRLCSRWDQKWEDQGRTHQAMAALWTWVWHMIGQSRDEELASSFLGCQDSWVWVKCSGGWSTPRTGMLWTNSSASQRAHILGRTCLDTLK